MDVRKIALVIASVLLVLALLVPIYTVKCDGVVVDDAVIKATGSFWGVVAIVTAAITGGAAFIGARKGYIVFSIISFGTSMYTLVNAAFSKEFLLSSVNRANNMVAAYGAIDGDNGLGSYTVSSSFGGVLIALAAIILLIVMIWNASNQESY